MPSLVASLSALSLVAQSWAHVSLVSIYGSNGAVGHGFGVNLYGKYPRRAGVPGDAGGDSGVFQTGTDKPSPPCGRTPELGPIDIPAWLDQAEAMGLPAAYGNMSVVVNAFQVNRDGGGPMSCEYNEDATGATWKPMFMTLNQAGNSGIQNQVRTNETVVMNFPAGAKCKGGWTENACIVRCRTGVNKRFGGCFAVKLADSTPAAVRTTVAGNASASMPSAAAVQAAANKTLELTPPQVRLIAEQVIIQMKKDGLVVAASTPGQQASPCGPAPALNASALSQISHGIQLDAAPSPSTLSTAAANQSLPHGANTSAAPADASDAADAHLYSISKATGSANVAADIVDNQVYNRSAPAAPADASDAADAHLYSLSKATGSAKVAADIVDNQAYDRSAPVAPSHPHMNPKHSSGCRKPERKQPQ